MNTDIQKAHSTYCQETGLSVTMAFGREHAWHDFLKLFTLDDLVTVVRCLKVGIKSGRRNPGCLKFHNLIEQLDMFEEELAEAKALSRNKPKPITRRDEVLVATFRPENDVPNPKTPKVILGDLEADWIAKLRAEIK